MQRKRGSSLNQSQLQGRANASAKLITSKDLKRSLPSWLVLERVDLSSQVL